LTAATGWLGHHVQRHGGFYEPREVITKAARQLPSELPLLKYLEDKFSDLYRL
jgi:carboxypeptidase Taq